MYINYGVSVEGVEKELIVSATATFVNVSGKVLFFYCYGPQGDLEWTRNASRAWTDKVMAANPPPPDQSSGGRGINWKKVIRSEIIGAVGGGLTVFILSIFGKKKNNYKPFHNLSIYRF